jgi:hypothetical protein
VFCGKNGEAPGLLNCCATGTIDCNGTCVTAGTYTTNDGACTDLCNTAYVQLRNTCGDTIDPRYDTFEQPLCAVTCRAERSTDCWDTAQEVGILQYASGINIDKMCQCNADGYKYFNYNITNGGRTYCYRCN